jgi:hypothetical protein
MHHRQQQIDVCTGSGGAAISMLGNRETGGSTLHTITKHGCWVQKPSRYMLAVQYVYLAGVMAVPAEIPPDGRSQPSTVQGARWIGQRVHLGFTHE